MTNIYPDTNTLLYEVQTTFSLQDALLTTAPSPHNLIILEAIQHELQTLKKRNNDIGRAANIALALIQQKDLKIKSTTTMYGDKALLEHATPKDYVVTADKNLTKKLKKHNINVLVPRQNYTLLQR